MAASTRGTTLLLEPETSSGARSGPVAGATAEDAGSEFTGATAKFAHVPFLDGLRAFAIFSVLTFHSCGPIGEFLIKRGGWLGVDAFFVLSGFLITSILLKEQRRTGTISLKQFYLRRALRLVPAYVLFMVAIYFCKPQQCTNIWAALAVAAVYMVDYDLALGWGNIYGSGLEIAWSLSVEEKFYMFWPALMKKFRKHLPALSIATICSCMAWKTFLILQTEGMFKVTTVFRLGSAFDTKVDAVMIGCLAALVLADERGKAWLQRYLSHGAIPMALMVLLVFYMRGMGLSSGATTVMQRLLYWDVRIPIFTALFAVLILTLSVQPKCLVARFFSLPPLTWIGRISYSMYLWHSLAFIFTIIYVFNFTMPASRVLLEVTDYAVAILFAACSYYIVEKPFLNLKERLGNKRGDS